MCAFALNSTYSHVAPEAIRMLWQSLIPERGAMKAWSSLACWQSFFSFCSIYFNDFLVVSSNFMWVAIPSWAPLLCLWVKEQGTTVWLPTSLVVAIHWRFSCSFNLERPTALRHSGHAQVSCYVWHALEFDTISGQWKPSGKLGWSPCVEVWLHVPEYLFSIFLLQLASMVRDTPLQHGERIRYRTETDSPLHLGNFVAFLRPQKQFIGRKTWT